MVSMSKAAEKLLRKLPTPACKVAGRRYREAYRRRTASRKLTYEEKKALLERRLKKKVSLLDDLKNIHAEMMERAVELHEKHGGHSPAYYYRMIMQQSSLNNQEPKEISLWNAFVSQKLTKFNDGVWLIACVCSVTNPTI